MEEGEEEEHSIRKGLGDLVLDADDSNKILAAENVDEDAFELPGDIETDDEEEDFCHFMVFGEDNTEYIDYIQCPFPNCSALFKDDGKGFLMRTCPKCCKIFCMKCRVGWHMDGKCHKNTLGKKIAIRIPMGLKSDQNYEISADSSSIDNIEGSEGSPVLESGQIQEVIDYSLEPFSSHEFGESSNSQISSSEFSPDEPVLDDDLASSQIQPSSRNHSSQEHGESSKSAILRLLGFETRYIDFIRCPFPNCSKLFLDDGEDFLIRACPKCWKIFCMECRISWHMGLKCRKVEQKKLAMRILMTPEKREKARFKRFKRSISMRKYGEEERRELKKSPLGSNGSKKLWEFLKDEAP